MRILIYSDYTGEPEIIENVTRVEHPKNVAGNFLLIETKNGSFEISNDTEFEVIE
tara:strand:+ start:27 stop:191 length:165 start_codon:yes stop_codon:yes gene_type:complete